MAAATSTSTKPHKQTILFPAKPVILFDGICRFCNKGVDFVIERDVNDTFRLAALQSDKGKEFLEASGRDPEDLSTILLIEDGKVYSKTEAILRIGLKLKDPWPYMSYMGFTVPWPIRDAVYDHIIAPNRYNFLGERDSCRLRSEGDNLYDHKFLT
eukprot:CAMPEP_0184653910 /NCGR_PEP_ID=MMETSP0308-20130426/11615_1 /TAXON_ID=38269 /ORGANISM="Gloeochaete witrockiana, Strain SAG 46.84" /LENGTH=155 /DNA_ID=CAMNT_0027089609 /DNA_START=222 /DNA_END=689 /DNA_ORIENTATION=-